MNAQLDFGYPWWLSYGHLLIHPDVWLKFAFGPLLLHGHTRGADWWSQQLTKAGFEVLEHGTRPGTLYLVSRRSR
ncbi:MAG: hypothetical protein IT168_23010 [Bryobacterales bacterium]|nr:hypothetical protein [Bryobacterales bacterium]